MTRLRERMQFVAFRMLHDQTDADDAVQDAYCNLLGAHKPETADETRYRLFAILRNVCLNKLKQRRNNVDLDALAGMSAPLAEPDDFPRLQRLLLESLPELQRKVCEMGTFEELDYPEIASQLDMSLEAVRMNMSRARRRLREEYKRLGL